MRLQPVPPPLFLEAHAEQKFKEFWLSVMFFAIPTRLSLNRMIGIRTCGS